MSSDNRTPRLHSFRIACAIATATCLKVLGILFVVQAATSLYAGSLETSVLMFGGEGAVGAQEIASSFDWTSLVLGIVLFMLSQLFLYARELYLDSDEIA